MRLSTQNSNWNNLTAGFRNDVRIMYKLLTPKLIGPADYIAKRKVLEELFNYNNLITDLEMEEDDNELSDATMDKIMVETLANGGVKPEFKYHRGDAVRYIAENSIGEVFTFGWAAGRRMYTIGIQESENNEKLVHVYENEISPIDKQEKEIAEVKEKPLNLCEILKDHIGKVFYSDVFGAVRLIKIDDYSLIISHGIDENRVTLSSDGSAIHGERCVIFPSHDQRDWNKFIAENEASATRVKCHEMYYFVNTTFEVTLAKDDRTLIDKLRYNSGNYFLTIENAAKAAEEIKNVIKSQHENKVNPE